MKRRTRRIIFYICFVAFLGLSYVTLLYAQGYKYSFSDGEFLRTGALSLKVNTDAKIFIQDKLAGDTSFLVNGFSKDRLLPGRYATRLQRDGYSPWQKTITVEEGRVTDFPNVLILSQAEEDILEVQEEIQDIFAAGDVIFNPTPSPAGGSKTLKQPSPSPQPTNTPFLLKSGKLTRNDPDATTELIAERVLGYSVDSNGRTLLWWTQNELWVLWLSDVESHQPFRKAGEREMITRFASPIKRAAWFRGPDHVVVDAGGLKIVEVDKRGGINIIKI